MMKKNIRLSVLLISLYSIPIFSALREQFAVTGYVELYDQDHAPEEYAQLYQSFDECIDFLQANPVWAQKLSHAKERFIRGKDRQLYSSDFLGFYDESTTPKRHQISCYYSVHFHDFLSCRFCDILDNAPINAFFDACRAVQAPCGNLFAQAATELQIEHIFEPMQSAVPVLLKVVKYFAQYAPVRPHYDGTVFSLMVHSTHPQSLLFSAYKLDLATDDFAPAVRMFHDRSMLLIPGTMVMQHDIFPTPHIVVSSGGDRYATIVFAMKPNYVHVVSHFAALPSFITPK